MHGSHFLNEEYQISASRLDNISKRKSVKSKNSDRLESEEEKGEKDQLWKIVKNFFKIVFALFLLIKGLIGSLRSSNISKLSVATQFIASYVTPKFLMFKRSFVLGRADISSSSVHRIVEVSPSPLHLIIALSGLDEAKRIMKRDSAAQLITPIIKIRNSTILEKIHIINNSTSIFEILAFSWCESYKKNKIYPTKLIITGPAKISSCVMGRYRWALKIPKEIISFQKVNGSELLPNFSDCGKGRRDPFDCNEKGREAIRSEYSEMCPEMAPILLACNNRIRLEKALAYKPKWAYNRKSK